MSGEHRPFCIIRKSGVRPLSIPDYLALVGDSADGYPGLKGWGAKSSAAVLAKFGHIESIPETWREWGVNVANVSTLADVLSREHDKALLFRTLATLRTDVRLFDDVEQLRWKGLKRGCDSHSLPPLIFCSYPIQSPSSRTCIPVGVRFMKLTNPECRHCSMHIRG